MASGTPRWRIALRSFLIGGAGGLLAGLYLANRGRESASSRLRRQMEREQAARRTAERRAEEAEHLASHALERERELAQRLYEAEQKLAGKPKPSGTG